MAHPLERVINEAEGFLLIGESNNDRFPAFSYNAYVQTKKKFYCLDMDGLTESRGPIKGGRVYDSIETLPNDRGDLALIWVRPESAVRAVELAYQAGFKRLWFSFNTGHKAAIDKAQELKMKIEEIGRCPVYYLNETPKICALHPIAVKTSGAYSKPPQLNLNTKRRELI
jgi:predicted CoA-binding protein